MLGAQLFVGVVVVVFTVYWESFFVIWFNGDILRNQKGVHRTVLYVYCIYRYQIMYQFFSSFSHQLSAYHHLYRFWYWNWIIVLAILFGFWRKTKTMAAHCPFKVFYLMNIHRQEKNTELNVNHMHFNRGADSFLFTVVFRIVSKQWATSAARSRWEGKGISHTQRHTNMYKFIQMNARPIFAIFITNYYLNATWRLCKLNDAFMMKKKNNNKNIHQTVMNINLNTYTINALAFIIIIHTYKKRLHFITNTCNASDACMYDVCES